MVGMPSGSGLPIKAGHLFIVGAIVMAIISAILFKNVVTSPKKEEKKAVAAESIVVAADYVPQGTSLGPEHMKLVKWPKEFLPSEENYFQSKSKLIGRIARGNLLPGEPIFRQKLSGEKSIGGLSVLIPPGMRAVTVAVTEIKGVAGFVKPGTRVDVLGTFELKNPDSTSGQAEDLRLTKTILQNVLVLASAQSMVDDMSQPDVEKPPALDEEEAVETKDSKKKDKPKEKTAKEIEKERKDREKNREKKEKKAKKTSSITLALTPEDAEKLALAEETGSIRLVLRSDADMSKVDVAGVSSSDLLTSGPDGHRWAFPAPKAEEPPKADDTLAEPELPPVVGGPSIEFIEGTSKTTVQF